LAGTVVIPARFGSTRFHAKIVAADTGKPLVQHVVDQVKSCTRVKQILVATDDQRIVDALAPFKTRCVMTSVHHQSGTDRIAEVARDLGDDIIVNVQGDEPEIEPEIIDALIARLETSTEDMATAATPFPTGKDPHDPNLVKVVMTTDCRAIYFSRAPIPYRRDTQAADAKGLPSANAKGLPFDDAAFFLHLGIYAYRREFLLQFASWQPTPLELTEKLEQLRALEHGRSIYVHRVERATHGIDTPEQYAEFVKRVKGVGGGQCAVGS
jgi:3-deoxy-manno-octulosonate cytidylyltransferase (CMP-KDO synthetase)